MYARLASQGRDVSILGSFVAESCVWSICTSYPKKKPASSTKTNQQQRAFSELLDSFDMGIKSGFSEQVVVVLYLNLSPVLEPQELKGRRR